jgi:hypothetical protein
MIHGRDYGIRAHLENVSVLGPEATYFLELCLPEKEALGIFAPMFHVNHFGTIGTFREPL